MCEESSASGVSLLLETEVLWKHRREELFLQGEGGKALLRGAFTEVVLFPVAFGGGIKFRQMDKRTGVADRGTNS